MTTETRRTKREVVCSAVCEGARVFGVLHLPVGEAWCGIVMIHGRPGYRVGAGRVFVHLARIWTAAGIAVLRMDYRGTAECEGTPVRWEETGQDIAVAVNSLLAQVPSLQRVVLWSSCGGAADAMQSAAEDPRIESLVLVNPWVYDVRNRARMKLKHHTGLLVRKLANAQWWRSVARGRTGQAKWVTAARILTSLREAAGLGSSHGCSAQPVPEQGLNQVTMRAHLSYRNPTLADQLARSLDAFPGKLLVILSGADMGAQAFAALTQTSPKWRALMAADRVVRHNLPGADHGFRRREWREQVAAWTLQWLLQQRK